jgi:hypothetical protein
MFLPLSSMLTSTGRMFLVENRSVPGSLQTLLVPLCSFCFTILLSTISTQKNDENRFSQNKQDKQDIKKEVRSSDNSKESSLDKIYKES